MGNRQLVIGGIRNRKFQSRIRGHVVTFSPKRTKLGKGNEARVYSRVVVVAGKRALRLAEKEFEKRFWIPTKSFRRPLKHFLSYEYLRTANIDQKLGLRLLPTLRIFHPNGNLKRLSILKTELPPLTLPELNRAQQLEYVLDRRRQINIMKKAGVDAYWKDVFYPVIDPATQKCVAVINDYGTIRIPSERRWWEYILTNRVVAKMIATYVTLRTKTQRAFQKNRKGEK